jgi:hypothetical protein
MNEEIENQLRALFQNMQDEADRMTDTWNTVGGALLTYTKNQQMLFQKLSNIFDAASKTGMVGEPAQRAPLTSQPAYNTPPKYPSTSTQPPWPPEGSTAPHVPYSGVSQRPPANHVNGATPPPPPAYSLREALLKADRQQ